MSDAIRIFIHSLTMVFRDFGGTLRATSAGLVLYAISVGLLIFAAPGAFGTFFAPSGSPDALTEMPNVGLLILGFLFMIIGSMMIIVAWHRFVLLPEDQRDGGFTPSPGIVLEYLGRSLLLGIAIWVLAIPLMIPVGIVASATNSPLVAGVAIIPVIAILGWVLMRLSLILPACAIGEKISFKESWNATKPLAGTVLGLMVLLAVTNFVLNLILGAVLTQNVISGLISVVVSLLYTLVSASILTTLYGIAIEKRSI